MDCAACWTVMAKQPRATSANVSARCSVKAVIAEKDSTTTIKQEQEYVKKEFLREKKERQFHHSSHGFGKSLIYQLAALVFPAH